MPWVTIQWFKGRDIETKKKVAKLGTKAICEGCGSAPDEVSIIFQDIKMSDWADVNGEYGKWSVKLSYTEFWSICSSNYFTFNKALFSD
jgi:phenylpyruvate tautomerase PptA (4-oxalocrotonate tautomerase family)